MCRLSASRRDIESNLERGRSAQKDKEIAGFWEEYNVTAIGTNFSFADRPDPTTHAMLWYAPLDNPIVRKNLSG
jgi:hypothetical protein